MLSKTDIIEEIQDKYPEIPKAKTNKIVSEVFKIIRDKVMDEGEKVQIQKFGKFEKKISHIKKGLDVVTGKEVVVRQRETFKFTGAK